MSVTVETNQPFVPQPVQQPVCNLVHADREEWIKVVEERLNCNTYGNTNYGVKIGFQTAYVAENQIGCTYNNDSTGQKVGPFYIYSDIDKIMFSGSYGQDHVINSLCFYDELGNYLWNTPDPAAKKSYEYAFISKDDGSSLQFNVNANHNANGYCLFTKDGVSKEILYVNGKKATWWQRFCYWLKSLFCCVYDCLFYILKNSF